ncbi:hypothetical protein [Oryzihumus leptocrescens]|uniref:Uncharacterized protein n=1 Tax=Oryzihumus leptocrescens TaxID=297536 RepID=A0A542ZKR6_9MICO|nr:hypothetical protein [Oryzihumus leptocrescens]TQL60945.1 hypothetical protein FB474_2345 [Oryzihumus leptocrescens]
MTGTEEEVRAALAGRRESALLAEPSVMAVARLLVTRCRDAGIWVRTAVGTLDRYAREAAGGDLAGLLAAGREDASVAQRSLEDIALRHPDLTAGQLAALAFGPTLWWTAAGVAVAWRPLGNATVASAGRPPQEPPERRPLPVPGTDPDVRLLLLALIGSGTTAYELLGVRVGDAGSLDAAGEVVPDLAAEPLALSFAPEDGGPRRVTFLPPDARAALLARLAERGPLAPEDPLLLPPDTAVATAEAADAVSAALIEAGNDVNVALCRATGDFFREWGMPGARFVARGHSQVPLT